MRFQNLSLVQHISRMCRMDDFIREMLHRFSRLRACCPAPYGATSDCRAHLRGEMRKSVFGAKFSIVDPEFANERDPRNIRDNSSIQTKVRSDVSSRSC